MKCENCKVSGGNMRACEACGRIFCERCKKKGEGGYPKTPGTHKCPWCGSYKNKVAL